MMVAGGVKWSMLAVTIVAMVQVGLSAGPSPYVGPRMDVGLWVTDMDASLRFYREALGFVELAEGEQEAPRWGRMVVLGLAGTDDATRLRLFEMRQREGVEQEEAQAEGERQWPRQSLVLRVRDMEAILERAAAAGFEARGRRGGEGQDRPRRFAILRDPDENVVMLMAAEVEGYHVHDPSRPAPEKVKPAAMEDCGAAPADAVVLFDGKDLSKWQQADGGEAGWKVADGYMEVVPKTGGIQTKQEFGNCQLHVEWQAAEGSKGRGQGRSNSGVFLMGVYEVQVLDTYENRTYADGQAGALYGQVPPLVNASLPAGQWQSFDIVFLRPMFDENGVLTRPARVTVLHNGVVVHNNFEMEGMTFHKTMAHYQSHGAKGPLGLQDHGDAVRFRNIWVRELAEEEVTALP